jgi:hypothetical protein
MRRSKSVSSSDDPSNSGPSNSEGNSESHSGLTSIVTKWNSFTSSFAPTSTSTVVPLDNENVTTVPSAPLAVSEVEMGNHSTVQPTTQPTKPTKPVKPSKPVPTTSMSSLQSVPEMSSNAVIDTQASMEWIRTTTPGPILWLVPQCNGNLLQNILNCISKLI